MILGALAIIIMVQIRISCTSHPAQYCDKLDSFKLYKKRFLGEIPGRTWCVMIALMNNSRFIPEDRDSDLLVGYTDVPITPIAKPSVPASNMDTCYPHIKYRMTQVLGIMHSCPSNNFKLFNLRLSCENWSLTEALEFICPGFTSDQSSVNSIIKLMQEYF